MPLKKVIDISIDETVVSGTPSIIGSNVIPLGITLTLNEFGGYCPAGCLIALQWGYASDWKTIRAGSGTFNFDMQKGFEGDSVKSFRVVLKNDSGYDQAMVAWAYALIDQFEGA
jgi:hypothetical protein